MTTIVFDASTLISLSEKCFLKILRNLSQHHQIACLIPKSVYHETVSRPEGIKRFELNAVRIKAAIAEQWLTVVSPDEQTKKTASQIAGLANHLFFAEEQPLELLHSGEIESLALFKQANADACAIDERTSRMILEDPMRLASLLSERRDQKITVNNESLSELFRILGKPLIVRSCDLLGLAFEDRQFEAELGQTRQGLEAALWSVKFAGCAVSGKEIEEFVSRIKT